MKLFECRESCGGKCCKVDPSGSEGYVFLTPQDAVDISLFLGTPIRDFSRTDLFESPKGDVERRFLISSKEHCRFFKDGKCGIYSVRPEQCRTFPYWPEYASTKAWNKLAEFCPGIKKESIEYEKVHEVSD